MRMTRRAMLTGLAALAGAGVMPLAAGAGEVTRIAGRAFGGGWTVTAPGMADPQALARRVAALLAEVDRQMSPFRADSEISRFNADRPRMAVPADLAHVAGAALEMARASGGAFDPTVGPSVNRFGFGPVRGAEPAEGWRLIACEGGLLSREGAVTLDLCGIAKGHAVDRVADLMRAEGHEEFLVEIAGEIRGEGDWHIGIADPVRGGVHSRLRLDGGAVATSGDAVNRFEAAGRRYAHTIDPATRRPVDNAIASVSVLAPTALRADALATALLVMGEERGLAFAEAQGAGALFLVREGAGLRARANPAFDAQLIRGA